jgi:hypothetical protein
MAWHTVDGILLSILGLHLRSRSPLRHAWLAYFLMGSAYLCKQSFVFVAPAALLVFGDWRNWRRLAAAALPGVLYLAVIASFGALPDAVQQLLSQRGIAQAGLYPYLDLRVLAGLLAGFAANSLLDGGSPIGWPRTRSARRALGFTVIAMAFAAATTILFAHGLLSAPLFLFGMVGGATIHMALERDRWSSRQIGTGAMVAVLAWSSSLSIGYNTPVFASGLLLTVLLARLQPGLASTGWRRRALIWSVAALAAVSGLHYVRTHRIYRESPASELTAHLGEVLRGARLIRTNPNTYAYMADLQAAIDTVSARGRNYATVPDPAAHWVRSRQKNPLPIDWPQGIELNTRPLHERVVRAIEDRRSDELVIVQKVRTEDLPEGFFELETPDWDEFHAVVRYVRTHLDKVGETKYFDIYR